MYSRALNWCLRLLLDLYGEFARFACASAIVTWVSTGALMLLSRSVTIRSALFRDPNVSCATLTDFVEVGRTIAYTLPVQFFAFIPILAAVRVLQWRGAPAMVTRAGAAVFCAVLAGVVDFVLIAGVYANVHEFGALIGITGAAMYGHSRLSQPLAPLHHDLRFGK